MTIMLPVDSETEQLARRMSEALGKPLPLIIKEAIEAKATAAGLATLQQGQKVSDDRLARMSEITDGFARLAVYDSRPANEIIGYDDNGVPQ